MALSGAERQAKYREKLKSETPLERLDLMVHEDTKRGISLLASCYGVTQREFLEYFIIRAQNELFKQFDEKDFQAYLTKKIKRPLPPL